MQYIEYSTIIKKKPFYQRYIKCNSQYNFDAWTWTWKVAGKNNETLVSFQKELYEKLHARGKLVTQDVVHSMKDYNFKDLSKYNDYVFVMAYDQYSESTVPGPIC